MSEVEHKFPIDLTIEEGFDKRTKIIRELYTSENIYVQNLGQIIEGYVEPLKEKKILTNKTISGIFSNVQVIHKFHVVFFTSLTQKVQSWDDNQLIGDLFLSMAPYLKLYSQYCANYDNSTSLVQQNKKSNPEFAQFLEETQKSDTFKGSYITSFLILPIQRIPRYEMFLTELLKKTNENHPDYTNIANSLDKVAELAKSVDGSCEKAENITKIIEISKSINMEKLLKPTRKYHREDNVEITFSGYSSFSSKCYVFNDIIVFTVKKSKIFPRNYVSYHLGLTWIYDTKLQDSIQLVTPNTTLIVKFSDFNVKFNWKNEVLQIIEVLSDSYKKKRNDYFISEESDMLICRSIVDTPSTVSLDDADDIISPIVIKEKRRKKSILDSWRGTTDRKKKKKKNKILTSNSEIYGKPVGGLQQSLSDPTCRRKSLSHESVQAIENYLSSQSEHDLRPKSAYATLRASARNLSLDNLPPVPPAPATVSGRTSKKSKKRDVMDVFNQMKDNSAT